MVDFFDIRKASTIPVLRGTAPVSKANGPYTGVEGFRMRDTLCLDEEASPMGPTTMMRLDSSFAAHSITKFIDNPPPPELQGCDKGTPAFKVKGGPGAKCAGTIRRI